MLGDGLTSPNDPTENEAMPNQPQPPQQPPPPAPPPRPQQQPPQSQPQPKPTPKPEPEDDAAALPKDFKLPEVGSRDYVAGQPVDDAELQKTQEAARKRIEEGRKHIEEAQSKK
jgi:hypothetical protein